MGGREGHGKQYDVEGNLRYDGEWLSNRMHGYGVRFYPNSQVEYEGEWKHGKRHGIGLLRDEDGSLRYDGDWTNGDVEGFGRFWDGRRTRYQGMWRSNKREGHGKAYTDDGALEYEGGWKNDAFHGEGTCTFAGSTYRGALVEGKRHGYGRWEGTDFVYEGEWHHDVVHGRGFFWGEQGAITYSGNYRNGYPDGWGEERVGGACRSGVFTQGVYDPNATTAKRKRDDEHDAERAELARSHRDSAYVSDVPTCALCLEEMHHGDLSYVYVPCGHRVVCGPCGATAVPTVKGRCVVCKANADAFLKVY